MTIPHVDGGSRGNPGPAAYGIRIEGGDVALIEGLQGAIGLATNNVAGSRRAVNAGA